MNTEEHTTEKQQENSKVPPQLQPHVFKKGKSGNPAGRPPTSSLKEFARRYLAGLTDEERIEYFEGIDKKVIWEMAEGKPDAKTESKVIVDVNNLKELPDDELDRIISTSSSN